MSLQTVLFPKSKYSVADAVDWLIARKMTAVKVDRTANFLRFRQRQPSSHGSYYTITLPDGIELVYEKQL